MYTFVTDTNSVAESDGTLFSMPQQGTVNASVILENLDAANTLVYHFQQFNGSVWSEMATIGNPLYNTLIPGQVAQVLVVSAYPQVRLNGSASGGATLGFSITRDFARTNGGAVPLMAGF